MMISYFKDSILIVSSLLKFIQGILDFIYVLNKKEKKKKEKGNL